MTDREEKIRQRAYGIWEEEGHPHGRADDHWHRAAREVESPSPLQAEPTLSLQPAEAAPAKKAAPKRRKAATGAVAAPTRAAAMSAAVKSTPTKRTPKKS